MIIHRERHVEIISFLHDKIYYLFLKNCIHVVDWIIFSDISIGIYVRTLFVNVVLITSVLT